MSILHTNLADRLDKQHFNNLVDRLIARLLRGPFTRLEWNSQMRADDLKSAVGHIESAQQRFHPVSTLHEAEFKVFSQWNEDGIIQYLIHKVPILNQTFIEFGVNDYLESNTRFLAMQDNWRGFILDAQGAFEKLLRESEFGWRYPVEGRRSMITRDNVNDLFAEAGFTGDIGLLSIDVDGNDYWIWDAIEIVTPRIVICEFNSTFGAEHAVTVPYDATFNVASAHPSQMFFGCSLPALCRLAEAKGYCLVGCESHGCNAFFVRGDLVGDLPIQNAQEAYVASRFRSARNDRGELMYLSQHIDRLRRIADCQVVDVASGSLHYVRDLYHLG